MKSMRKIKYIVLSIILCVILCNLNIIISSTYEASLLFFNKVFISLFPFMILIDILLYFKYEDFLNNIFGGLFCKLFKISKNCSSVIIISLLTGAPNNGVIIKRLLDKECISLNEANKVLNFTFFPSIVFVIGVVGIGLYNSFKIGLGLYLCIILNNLFIGLFLRKESFINNEFISLKNDVKFISYLKNSIIKNFNTMILILGNIILFFIIIGILKLIIHNEIILSILSGLLEMTSGVFMISSLNISLCIKLYLTSFILCFSGLSILFQCFSILENYKIKVKKILFIRLVFSLLSSLFILLFCF